VSRPLGVRIGSHGQRAPVRGLLPREEPTVRNSLTVATCYEPSLTPAGWRCVVTWRGGRGVDYCAARSVGL